MAKIIIFLCLIALAIFMIVVLYKHFTTKTRIKSAFTNGNVCVYGPKGYGKDVLFQYVINIRKDTYFANYNYGGDYNHIDIKEMELGENTYNNFIKGDVIRCDKNHKLENHDIYISDCGVYLPSQCDSILHKIYPSLPISYALSRHLWNNGIHANAQRLERIWKALREQADYYIRLRKRRLKLPFFLVIFTTEYEKYDSALQNLNPMRNTLFNKYSKAEKELYLAKHGFIKNGLLIVRKSILQYDSRAFHKIIFGENAPRKETLWKRLLQHLKKKGASLKDTWKALRKRK